MLSKKNQTLTAFLALMFLCLIWGEIAIVVVLEEGMTSGLVRFKGFVNVTEN